LNLRDELMAHQLLEPWSERSRKGDLQIHGMIQLNESSAGC